MNIFIFYVKRFVSNGLLVYEQDYKFVLDIKQLELYWNFKFSLW